MKNLAVLKKIEKYFLCAKNYRKMGKINTEAAQFGLCADNEAFKLNLHYISESEQIDYKTGRYLLR